MQSPTVLPVPGSRLAHKPPAPSPVRQSCERLRAPGSGLPPYLKSPSALCPQLCVLTCSWGRDGPAPPFLLDTAFVLPPVAGFHIHLHHHFLADWYVSYHIFPVPAALLWEPGPKARLCWGGCGRGRAPVVGSAGGTTDCVSRVSDIPSQDLGSGFSRHLHTPRHPALRHPLVDV